MGVEGTWLEVEGMWLGVEGKWLGVEGTWLGVEEIHPRVFFSGLACTVQLLYKKSDHKMYVHTSQ